MKVKDFNLKQTLECGQCFNFEKITDNGSDDIKDCFYEYIVLAKGRMLYVRQAADELFFLRPIKDKSDEKCSCELPDPADGELESCPSDEIRNIWIPYFDLERDYGLIKEKIIQADERLKDIIGQYYGVRILNQDFAECLMSFIISQNSNIPRIRKTVGSIGRKYGRQAGSYKGKDYYVFPEEDQLDKISEEDYRELKTGFRAAYLRSAADWLAKKRGAEERQLQKRDADERLAKKRGTEERLKEMSFTEAKAELMQIKGVGDKVADCVLLFSLAFRNAFPVDVWIKRIMEEMYFDGELTDKKVIEAYADGKFGEYGGYAQQYLFMYARNRGNA